MKRKPFSGISETLSFMFSFIWKHQKTFFLWNTVQNLVVPGTNLAEVWLSKLVMDEIFSETRTVERIAFYVGLMLLCYLVRNCVRELTYTLIRNNRHILYNSFRRMMVSTVCEADYELLETPVTHELKENAEQVAYGDGAGFCSIVQELFSLGGNFITLAGITAIIFTLNPLFVLLLLALIFVNSMVRNKCNKLEYALRKNRIPIERKSDYLSDVSEGFEYGKEVRLWNLKDFIVERLEKHDKVSEEFYRQSYRVSNRASYLSYFTSLIQQGASYAYLVFLVFTEGMTIGSFTMYMSALNKFNGVFNSFFSAYTEMANSKLYFQDLQNFLNLKRRADDSGSEKPQLKQDTVISFSHVSFHYPGTDRDVLHDVTLDFKIGEKVALVGANGAGKSTFIKLLVRLYDPTEGEILLNGKNIKEYDYNEYLNLFAPVFQDFKLFAFTLRENLALTGEYDDKRMEKIVRQVGLDSRFAEQGLDTILYKEYDESGTELSGGEAQRLAIARALYRNSPMVVLDEPTAALDPLAEYNIYQMFGDLVDGKTAFFVTHRLGSVRFCDDILVFDNGQVIARGTHSELMKKNDIYAEMFTKQSDMYKQLESKQPEEAAL